ncbi:MULTISPECIES: cytochrome b [Halopseudomonas]|uniref:Cytochrome b/b6 domain-containing protein n=1 Tax=Halopseudomonas formosensis TaxID=1002526 RepID=A0ABU5BYR2_9GAMM|nr:cytochrome b/b6 domain-containing protein [Halopseudomonas formosensis]MDX9687806.1 cytochrome b/b6 domain-containing protein [Halopseudomonas formosensis]NLC00336.1 cytochrome b [Halopseudomonas formosensis]
MNDSKERYGALTRFFHWGMGLLIVWQFLKFFDRINDGEHWVGQTLVPWHISIGSLLLVLIVLRILWAVGQRKNRPEQDPATALLVKAGHGLLYLCMLLLPITGLMIMIGNGYGWSPFGKQLVARGATDIEWMATLGSVHSLIAWTLLILVVGHVGMALLHQLVKKDGVLRRML